MTSADQTGAAPAPTDGKKKPFITPQEICVGLLTVSDRVRRCAGDVYILREVG